MSETENEISLERSSELRVISPAFKHHRSTFTSEAIEFRNWGCEFLCDVPVLSQDYSADSWIAESL